MPSPLGRILQTGYEITLGREITDDELELLISKLAGRRMPMPPSKDELEKILNAGW